MEVVYGQLQWKVESRAGRLPAIRGHAFGRDAELPATSFQSSGQSHCPEVAKWRDE